MQSKSFLAALLGARCPRCREGKMYAHHTYNISKLTQMNPTCSHCQLRFEVEPGFFYGAMFLSYTIAVAEIVALFVGISALMTKPSVALYLTVIITALVMLTPFNFRYSRVLMLHLFGGISYQKGDEKRN